MNTPIAVLAVIGGGIVFWLGMLRRRAGVTADGRITAVLRIANQVGLPVESRGMGERIAERLRRERRISAWAVPPAVLIAAAVAIGPVDDAAPVWMLLPMYIVVAGAIVGGSIAAVVTGFRLDPSRPRVARLRVPERRDYADPLIVVGTRLLVLLGAAVALVSALLGRNLPIIAIAALLSVAVLAGAELTAERLARHPQHAADHEELRWDDALRALALNQLYAAPTVLAVPPILIGGIDLSIAYLGDTIAFLPVYALLFAALILAAVRRPGRRAVRALWGTELPEEVQ